MSYDDFIANAQLFIKPNFIGKVKNKLTNENICIIDTSSGEVNLTLPEVATKINFFNIIFVKGSNKIKLSEQVTIDGEKLSEINAWGNYGLIYNNHSGDWHGTNFGNTTTHSPSSHYPVGTKKLHQGKWWVNIKEINGTADNLALFNTDDWVEFKQINYYSDTTKFLIKDTFLVVEGTTSNAVYSVKDYFGDNTTKINIADALDAGALINLAIDSDSLLLGFLDLDAQTIPDIGDPTENKDKYYITLTSETHKELTIKDIQAKWLNGDRILSDGTNWVRIHIDTETAVYDDVESDFTSTDNVAKDTEENFSNIKKVSPRILTFGIWNVLKKHTGNTSYVASYGDDVKGTGSFFAPFNTIQKAIDEFNQTEQTIILLDNVNGGDVEQKNNGLKIIAQNSGSIATLVNSNLNNITLENIAINSFQISGNGHIFKDVHLENQSNVSINNSGEVHFINCNFNHNVVNLSSMDGSATKTYHLNSINDSFSNDGINSLINRNNANKGSFIAEIKQLMYPFNNNSTFQTITQEDQTIWAFVNGATITNANVNYKNFFDIINSMKSSNFVPDWVVNGGNIILPNSRERFARSIGSNVKFQNYADTTAVNGLRNTETTISLGKTLPISNAWYGSGAGTGWATNGGPSGSANPLGWGGNHTHAMTGDTETAPHHFGAGWYIIRIQ